MMRALALAAALLGAGVAPRREPVHVVFVYGEAAHAFSRGYSHDDSALERAWCVTGWARVPMDSSALYVVYRVDTAAVESATTATVAFSCHGLPEAHTHPGHPPFGSPADFYCQPSVQDREHLDAQRAPFGIVVCGVDKVVLYLPDGVRP
jgi:hypothetical protein